MGGVILIVLLGIAFAAGYGSRELISRKRRAEARRWRNYVQPDWLNANAPANANEVRPDSKQEPSAPPTGELGQMLDRWEQRARTSRAG